MATARKTTAKRKPAKKKRPSTPKNWVQDMGIPTLRRILAEIGNDGHGLIGPEVFIDAGLDRVVAESLMQTHKSGRHPKSKIFVDGVVVKSLEAVYTLDVLTKMIFSLGLKGSSAMGRGFQARADTATILKWCHEQEAKTRELCGVCDRLKVNELDPGNYNAGDGEHLCWGDSQCREKAVNWRGRCLDSEKELKDLRLEHGATNAVLRMADNRLTHNLRPDQYRDFKKQAEEIRKKHTEKHK